MIKLLNPFFCLLVLLLHMPAFEDNRLLLPSHLPSEIRCVVLPDQYHTCTKKDKQNMVRFCFIFSPLFYRDILLHHLNFISIFFFLAGVNGMW